MTQKQTHEAERAQRLQETRAGVDAVYDRAQVRPPGAVDALTEPAPTTAQQEEDHESAEWRVATATAGLRLPDDATHRQIDKAIDDLYVEIERLQEDKVKVMQDHDKVSATLAHTRAKLASAEKERDELRAEADITHPQVVELMEENRSLAKRVKNLEIVRRQADAEIERLDACLKNASDEAKEKQLGELRAVRDMNEAAYLSLRRAILEALEHLDAGVGQETALAALWEVSRDVGAARELLNQGLANAASDLIPF